MGSWNWQPPGAFVISSRSLAVDRSHCFSAVYRLRVPPAGGSKRQVKESFYEAVEIWKVKGNDMEGGKVRGKQTQIPRSEFRFARIIRHR